MEGEREENVFIHVMKRTDPYDGIASPLPCICLRWSIGGDVDHTIEGMRIHDKVDIEGWKIIWYVQLNRIEGTLHVVGISLVWRHSRKRCTCPSTAFKIRGFITVSCGLHCRGKIGKLVWLELFLLLYCECCAVCLVIQCPSVYIENAEFTRSYGDCHTITDQFEYVSHLFKVMQPAVSYNCSCWIRCEWTRINFICWKL